MDRTSEVITTAADTTTAVGIATDATQATTDKAPETEKKPAYKFSQWNIAGYTAGEQNAHNQRVIEVIKKLSSDVFVINETVRELFTENPELAESYDMVDDRLSFGSKPASGNLIIYRKELFELVSAYTYSLSDKPTENSKVDGSYHYRYATFAEFRVKKDGKTFFVIATHLENNSSNANSWPEREAARVRQAEILLDLISLEKPAGVPFVIMGDLNSYIDSKEGDHRLGGIKQLLESGLVDDAKKVSEFADSAGSWVGQSWSFDYLLISKGDFNAKDYNVKTDYNNGNPSDHNPITLVFEFAK